MEYQLQIEFIHETKTHLNIFINKNDLIQTIPFKIGFLIKNIGKNALSGAKITNITWGSSDGQNIFSTSEKNFDLGILNPNEETKIWVDDTGTYMHGLCHVRFNINTNRQNENIKTFQKDQFTGSISPCNTINSWVDFFFVRSKTEYEQSALNNLTLCFVIVSTILAVFTFYLARQQTYYTEIQSRSERIMQARQETEAVERCKQSPDLEDSGLYNTTNGKPATCKEVLSQNKI